uniref:Putative secreted protein n=1 Tax=Rhipicephalus microplus TaxID=6941 RepID=A0A6M2DCT5_RHIMP
MFCFFFFFFSFHSISFIEALTARRHYIRRGQTIYEGLLITKNAEKGRKDEEREEKHLLERKQASREKNHRLEIKQQDTQVAIYTSKTAIFTSNIHSILMHGSLKVTY